MIDDEKKFFEGQIHSILKFKGVPSSTEFKGAGRRINNCIEILYYLKGHDVTRMGNNLLVNTPDTIKIAPPYNQTKDRPEIKVEAEYEIIDIAVITPCAFTDKTLVMDVSNYPEIKKLFLKLFDMWSAKYDDYYFNAMSTYYLLIKEIYNLLHPKELVNTKHPKLKNAIRFINSNYCDKNFSCDKLPQLCGWKRSYFYEVFEKQFKTTPQKYLHSLRMQLAVDLLFEGKLSISEIANRCGYESSTYFGRVFKNYYGVSPSQYIQKL